MKVTKATKKTLSDKLKTATRALADKLKKHVLRTQVLGDMIWGRRRQLPPCTVRACPVL